MLCNACFYRRRVYSLIIYVRLTCTERLDFISHIEASVYARISEYQNPGISTVIFPLIASSRGPIEFLAK